MMKYYAVLDYAGWEAYRALNGDVNKYTSAYERFYYASTCLDNVNAVCRLLNLRRIG